MRKFPKRILTIEPDRPERIFHSGTPRAAGRFLRQVADRRPGQRSTRRPVAFAARKSRISRLSEIIKNAIVTEFGKRSVQEAISVERVALMRDMLETATIQRRRARRGTDRRSCQAGRIPGGRPQLGVLEQMREERARVAAERRAQGREIQEEKMSAADKSGRSSWRDANRQVADHSR